MNRKRIDRKEYLDKLIAFKDKQIIKIITGVRRCGKSTIMEIFKDYLRNQGVPEEQIVSVNLEDYDFYDLRNSKKLHEYVKERLVKDKITYVFLMKYSIARIFPVCLTAYSLNMVLICT